MVRPIVLVFQEFATITAVPTTPDLNCLIVGPAFQLQDYPDDQAAIEVANYGTLNANNPYVPPVASVPTITLAAAPNLEAGAWVDPASIQVYFDEARVILASGTDGVTTTTAPDENTLSSTSATFITDGVAAGDTLIVDVPLGAPPNLVLTVLTVDSETVLRVTNNFVAIDTGLSYRVERELSDQLISSVFVNEPTFRISNQIEILGGVTLTVAAVSRVVAYARVYVEYRAYRTDLQIVDEVNTTTDITTNIGRIDSRNPLAAGVFLAKQNAGQAPIQYFGVETQDLIGYTKVRDTISTDESIYAVVPMISDLTVVSLFKTDNETLADPNLALASGVPQKFRVVIGDGTLGVNSTVSAEVVTGTTEPFGATVPPLTKTITLGTLTALTNSPPLQPGDLLTLTASENVGPIDGVYTIAHLNSETELEVDEAFPTVIGAAEGVNYTVTRPSTGATLVALDDNRAFSTSSEDVVLTSRVAGIIPGARTLAFTDVNTTAGGIHTIVETPGSATEVSLDLTVGTITAQEVVDAINSGTGVTVAFSGSVNLVASTPTPATAQTTISIQLALALTGTAGAWTGAAGADDLTSTTVQDQAYVRLFDAAASFITDGVIAGDTIEMPENPNGVFGSNVKQFTVNTVVSEQRLEILNIVSGAYVNNTSLLENELPHLDNRLGAGAVAGVGSVDQGTIRYRVIRELTRTQQVSNLVATSQSLNSRRAILAWPDTVKVSGLVDGSLAPNGDGTAADAANQPGYYLGCVIGGMTAGLPSHQGFSRLGINGIEQIFNSGDYFSEEQLTDISDGGWYVFKQNTPTSLPYSIHQLTTDPSTLESGEYSIVKNFDFVSLFFLDILEPFLGIWNINEDTLGFIRQAVNTGIENLKLRRVARIGAPINNATITSLEVSTASADRVEIFVEVDLPKPLNVIGLHLVG